MIPAFPKIFHVGEKYISKLFDGPVEITEKVDGSQFVFGKMNGELFCRSKGKILVLESLEKMFSVAVDYIVSNQDKLEDDTIYFAEYLRKPKHNVLCYLDTPRNHLALFGVMKKDKTLINYHKDLGQFADNIGVDVVPLIHWGEIKKPEDIFSMVEKESFLGGVHMEGLVVKNYAQEFMLGGQVFPLMSGKYVTEKFKEKHRTDWKKENTGS